MPTSRFASAGSGSGVGACLDELGEIARSVLGGGYGSRMAESNRGSIDALAVPTPPVVKMRVTELATLLVAGLLLVVVSPQVLATHWTPKVALALLMVGPGLAALGLAAFGRDRSAIAGLVFVGVAAASTILSPSPMLSLVGMYNHGTGWLFVAAVVGMWALGRRLSVAGAERLAWVLLGAAFVNAAMVWLQSSRTVNGDLFTLVDGRPPGLLGNPVHATALFLGALALIGERWRRDRNAGRESRERSVVLLGLAALIASAIELAGGRIGIVVIAVVVVIVGVRTGARRTVPFVIAVVLGLGAATFAAADGTGAASRVAASGNSAFSGRIDRWKVAEPAVEARPILGIGPGLYRRGTSRFSTPASARAFGADSLNIDAHNLVVEYLVTTGVLGTAALLAWLVLASRGARGELAWFAAVGAVSLALQPEFVGLTPVLALALGAAKRGPPSARYPRILTVAAAVTTLVAMIAGAGLLYGDAQQRETVVDLNPSVGRRAVRALPVWPEPESSLARAYSFVAISKHRAIDWKDAIDAARAARRRDPSDPDVLNRLGGLELAHGSIEHAKVAFTQSRYWNPQSVTASLGLATIASFRGDQQLSNRLCAQAKRLAPRAHCPIKPIKPSN